MITRLITRDSLKRLISNILPNFQVIAPVSGEKISFFKRISAYEEIDWSERYTTKPPKEFLFPAAEDLFQFRIKNKEILLSEPDSHHGQKIILGIKPCDAAGLKILDQVLLHDGIDLPYISLREDTLLIGQLCRKPGTYCFCTSVGVHPHDCHNMDLMLADLGEDKILVQVVSRKGEEFVTLDDNSRTLDRDMLLICDGEEPVAIAGVMGGLNSEVTDST
ncbi:MAG: phenylalanine--tRNA ligase beta subunit-related protein, partial [bacterium]